MLYSHNAYSVFKCQFRRQATQTWLHRIKQIFIKSMRAVIAQLAQRPGCVLSSSISVRSIIKFCLLSTVFTNFRQVYNKIQPSATCLHQFYLHGSPNSPTFNHITDIKILTCIFFFYLCLTAFELLISAALFFSLCHHMFKSDYCVCHQFNQFLCNV